MQILHGCPLTYNKAVVGAVPTVVQTAAGLEQEKATGSVEVVRRDARYIQAFSFSQQLLFPGQRAAVRSGLGSEVTGGHTVRQCWWSSVSKKLEIKWESNITIIIKRPNPRVSFAEINGHPVVWHVTLMLSSLF